MFDVSLCILACNRPEGVQRLVESVRAFDDFRVEVVIGDNSTQALAQREHAEIADVWFHVSDRELWFDGFGVCKTKIIQAAANDLVLVGDADEQWRQTEHSAPLARSSWIARTGLLSKGAVAKEHGRVFNRKVWRLLGMIHEEPYNRRSRANWGAVAPPEHFALIEHDTRAPSPSYLARKAALYDNLIYRIAQDPDMSPGTNRWWVEEYLPSRIAEGFEPMSFEQWSEEYHD